MFCLRFLSQSLLPLGRAGAIGILTALACSVSASDWPGFRGDGSSVTEAKKLPLAWSSTNGIAWRAPLPGPGQSSPIIWQGKVYAGAVTGPRKEELALLALSLRDGKEAWRFATNSSAPEELSNMRSQGAPTPVASKDGVFAFFESGDCLAVSHEGKLRWHTNLAKSFGAVTSNHGLGGSPVLHDSRLYIPLDQEGPAALAALNTSDGSIAWKTARTNKTSWSAPVVYLSGTNTQIILSGGGTVASYHPATGAPLWEFSGLIQNNVPSPSLYKDTLVIGAGSKGSNLALSLSPTPPAERWRALDASCGFASPLIYQGRVYFLSRAGVLSCVDFESGKMLFNERLPQAAWASPVGAEGRVYVFGDKGVTTVLEASSEYRPLATNTVSVTGTVTGVAVADGAFILRAGPELICIGSPDKNP